MAENKRDEYDFVSDSWTSFWCWLELHLPDFDKTICKDNNYYQERTKQDWKNRIYSWYEEHYQEYNSTLYVSFVETWEIIPILAMKKVESQKLFDEELSKID